MLNAHNICKAMVSLVHRAYDNILVASSSSVENHVLSAGLGSFKYCICSYVSERKVSIQFGLAFIGKFLAVAISDCRIRFTASIPSAFISLVHVH